MAEGTLINTDTIFNVAEQERLGHNITAQAESSSEASPESSCRCFPARGGDPCVSRRYLVR